MEGEMDGENTGEILFGLVQIGMREIERDGWIREIERERGDGGREPSKYGCVR